MEAFEGNLLRTGIEDRRSRLGRALEVAPGDDGLVRLLAEVDAALDRLDRGTYGICEACHEGIESDRLLADPLVRFCLDHLPERERRDLERDLELAAKVQRGLLPAPGFAAHGWEVRHVYRPASAVSGDYCDVIAKASGESGLYFALGDVSGKGVAASMLMTQLQAMFRSLSSAGLSLREVVAVANRVLCENALAGQYATLVCGTASGGGAIEMANAGHLPAMVVRRGGVERFPSGSVPLGMFCSVDPCFCTVRLEPGESVVLFTDGLSETRGAGGAEYGVDRYERLLRGHPGATANAIIDATLADLREFSNGRRPDDDMTLMVLRRTL